MLNESKISKNSYSWYYSQNISSMPLVSKYSKFKQIFTLHF